VLGALSLGLIFGFLWIPCVTPILASVLIYVSIQGNVLQGGTLLFVYGLGFSIPLVILSVFLTEVRSILTQRTAKIGYYLEKACGLILIALGGGMILSLFNLIPPIELLP